MAKKYKTVAGYLRNASDDLCAAQEHAKLQGRQPISDDDGYRQILNNLLSQRGLGRIGDHESPTAGIQRLQQTAPGQSDAKLLSDCLKWLRTGKWQVTSTGYSEVTDGEIVTHKIEGAGK